MKKYKTVFSEEPEEMIEHGISLNLIKWGYLVLLIVAVLLWGYNAMRLKHIEVDGLTQYEEKEFVDQFKESILTTNTFYFYIHHKYGAAKQIPFIEHYDIIYLDRHSIQIQVHEKIVTGCVEVMGKYMYFDKDGIVVESSTRKREDVPVVVGLKYEEILLYHPLKIERKSMFSILLQLTKLLTENEIKAQKIVFDTDYSVTLIYDGVTVLLGRREMYDEQLVALKGVINVLSERQGTLDMRNYSKENTDIILK